MASKGRARMRGEGSNVRAAVIGVSAIGAWAAARRAAASGLAASGLAALALAAAIAAAAPQSAHATPPIACPSEDPRCDAACARACATDDAACLAACGARLAAPEEAGAAPSVAAPPAAASRVQTANAEPLSPHILFLSTRDREPERALYYGYLLIGEGVSAARKAAVAEAVACRLKALPDLEAAAAVERLGLVSLPALREAGATQVSPAEVLDAYDFRRAAVWLRAAGVVAGERFDPDRAIVFVASSRARARQMDSVAMPGPDESGDPVIADASALSAAFAAAWAGSIIDGMERGAVRSRQEFQLVMEANSWITWATAPVTSLFRITPAHAAAAPAACP
ncbi:MAG: hypothetical protein AAGM38_00390 [Pseudomonadota bacterium]